MRMLGMKNVITSPGTMSGINSAKQSLLAIFLSIALVACGGDSGTSANNDKDTELAEVSSCSQKAVSSSSVKASSSSVKVSSSSVILSSSEGSSASRSSSSQKIASSSSTPRNDVSSSSVKAASSSSSVIPASSGNPPSSSSKKVESSSSEYVPYNHEKCLAGNWNISTDDYKQFTDPRNGRSYYYYTTVSSKTGKKVTVMAENLNIGDMVLGENDQNNDAKIERYCYNNDTTYCDEFGGLYQWAEMMQLPSRCNTESCADLIQENHRGICPEGWRLLTWDDYVIIRQYNDEFDHGIEGLRSQCFNGYNTSGFSLVSAGYRSENGIFEQLNQTISWYYPNEDEYNVSLYAHANYVSGVTNHGPAKDDGDLKTNGLSVRCVKLE